MKTVLLSILAVLAGSIIGSFINMGILMAGIKIILPPAGADVLTEEGLKASMHLFEPKHFITPWLAHALGTFAGALITTLIAPKNKLFYALGIGVIFLAGGIANVIMLPSPVWFTFVDLVGAYIPMAYLAWILVGRKQKH